MLDLKGKYLGFISLSVIHHCLKIGCPICNSYIQKSYKTVLSFTKVNEKHSNSPIEKGMQEVLCCFFFVKQ